ncbi:Cell wall-associated polypeptide CWBP200 [Streptomyces netropsis]|nr:Cell wall-associated polypeptide CWBP200 [Streptomyces netropsis]
MSFADEAKNALEKIGLHWPDGDPGKLRKAAAAWQTFADSVDAVRTPVNNTAGALIRNNKGEAIDAFEVFWSRYAGDGGKGWLSDIAKAAREMATGLEKLAKAIEDAVDKLQNALAINGAVIVAGFGLAAFTLGASAEASAVAAAGIIRLGATMGVTISAVAAEIAATTLIAAAFSGVESVAVNLAVAQPMKIAAGLQGGFSLPEVNAAAKDGMLFGGMFGGALGGVGALTRNAALAGGYRNLLKSNLRPNIVELPAAARPTCSIKCDLDPIDVATGAMLLPQTDVTLPGDLPLVVERTHLSSYRAGGWFGPSWASTLDERVQLDAEGVVFAAADGMRLVYPVPDPSTPALPVKGPRWPLSWDGTPDGALTITDPFTGVVRTFGGASPTDVPGAVQLPLESVQDRNGARIDIERSLGGVPTGIRHTGGYYVAVDTQGPRVTALRLLDKAPSLYEPQEDFGGGTVLVRYGYDDAGNLAEVINSSGKPLRFTYDAEGRITSWTDRNATSYSYVYDSRGRVVRTEGSDGFLSGALSYDDESRTTTVTDSVGRQRTYRHNADCQVVEEIDPLGHTTLTEWDARGDQRLSITDPLGRTTRYAYDEAGNLHRATLPDGSTAQATYNPLCQPTEVIEPAGARWLHTYDERGNRLTTTDPAGAEASYSYDDSGRLTAVTDALGHTHRITCNPAGLPLAVVDPLGHTTTVRRDVFGRVTEAIDPLGHTTRMGWTTEGKPLWREQPDGTRETWTWDGEGNLLTHTDPAGNTTEHTHTHFDLQASRTDPNGTRYDFAYDTELRLTGVTNPQGLTWSYDYDAAGRLVSETDFNGRTLTYAHDATGALLSRINGAGESLHFTRDRLGRTTEQRSDAGETTTYAYDASGSLIRTANADAEITWERDALGRPLTETVNGRTTRYTYDALGRRTQRTTPSGLLSEWTYDAASRPVELGSDAGSLTFTYDAAGRETGRRIGEGATLTQTWDATDRLTTQTITGHHQAADRLLQHRSYAYRADGYLTEIRELTSGTRRFDLDRTGRVTSVSAHGWSETYAYDGAGNLTHATAPEHPAPGDREFSGTLIRRAGRTAYEHDAQGRLVRKTRKLLNGQTRTWTYQWNAEDRLTEAVTPEGERWRYAYDPLGRRTAKQRLSDDGSVEEETTFAWDGTRLAEQSALDGKTVTWEYAPGTHRPVTQTDHNPTASRVADDSLLSKFTGSTQREFDARFHAIITDLVGTPTELVSPAGDLAWQHRTTLWGTHLPAPPEGAVDCPLRFPGQYHDAETGLDYNHFRYYDPEAYRYIAPDPLGLEPSPNHHSYILNPYSWADPLGLAPDGCSVPPARKYSPSRNSAFRDAKRDLGIPMSQQPDDLRMVPMTDRTGRQIMGDNGQPVMTREYIYTREDGKRVIVQDHSAGHDFGEGGVGNQGRHLNVRPYENPRTGKVPGTAQHYEY